MRPISNLIATFAVMVLVLPVAGLSAERSSAVILIADMDCAACTTTVRIALERVEGVERATVDYDSKRAVVEFDPGVVVIEELLAAVRGVGFTPQIVQEVGG